MNLQYGLNPIIRSVCMSRDGTRLVLDGWLPFRATDHAQLALLALRREVDALVLATVAGHASRASLAPTAKAVRDVLALLASADM